MFVEILSIGDEILNGSTVNFNAAFLSREMSGLGCRIVRHTAIPDEPSVIARCVREALDRSDLVIATGGMGPTLDDVTREASDLLGFPLNSLKNRIGSAEGKIGFFEKKALVLLPGVPREMQAMFREEAIPQLLRRCSLPTAIHALDLFLCGMREIEVDPLLRRIKIENPDAKIGIYPSLGLLKIRFEVDQKPQRLEAWKKLVEREFPSRFFEGPSLAAAVHRELIRSSATLGLAESCTGGALSSQLTSLPDASKYFLGSLVVYSNAWKEKFLGVRPKTLSSFGAVSEQAISEMLDGLFDQTKADWGIAISGIAGPSGGTVETPIGTIYCGIGRRGEKHDIGRLLAPSDRASAIEFAVQHALGALFRRLHYQTRTFSEQL